MVRNVSNTKGSSVLPYLFRVESVMMSGNNVNDQIIHKLQMPDNSATVIVHSYHLMLTTGSMKTLRTPLLSHHPCTE